MTDATNIVSEEEVTKPKRKGKAKAVAKDVPSVLTLPTAFNNTSSITQNDGVLWGVEYAEDGTETLHPVRVEEIGILAPKSYHKLQKSAKEFEQVMQNNPQVCDKASLPVGCTKLRLDFNVDFAPALFNPEYLCINNRDYKAKLTSYINEFINQGGMKVVAEKFATQLMSGEWFWRNGLGATGHHVVAETSVDNSHVVTTTVDDNNDVRDDLTLMAESIQKALEGKTDITTVSIKGYLDKSSRATVYPSQDMTRETVKVGGAEKSKILFTVPMRDGTRQAALHSQKLGNKIRRIDDWYSDENVRAIPLYTYGHDRIDHEPKRVTFKDHKALDASMYCYLENLESMYDELVKDGLDNRHYYVISMLLCGGVFSAAKSD